MKSFREQQKDKENATKAAAPSKENSDDKIAALGEMTEGDLMATLLKEADKAKRNGTLNGNTLKAFYDQVAPMLTEEQRAKMQELMRLIS